MEIFDQLSKLLQILFIDLIFAGDNAIVIGMVAARFTEDYRRKVIFWGVGIAVLLRILFALITVQLLAITGLMLIGGLLLLWICWTLWKQLREESTDAKIDIAAHPDHLTEHKNPSLPRAIMQIVVADVSMSLDNVIAVAGVSDGHNGLLIIGLTISVVFMMFFATWIANLLQKYSWIGYVGLAIILYVAIELIYKGGIDVLPLIRSFI